jgi:hypothetical protein
VNTKKIFIKKSKLHGKGIFAQILFRKGDPIYYIKGRVMPIAEFIKLPLIIRNDGFRFSSGKYLDSQSQYGEFQNHSCVPNARIIKRNERLYLVAIRDIKAKSEITFDYSTILAKDDFWEMKCRCKNTQCRKRIKQYPLLPEPTLKKYLAEKMIPSYILKITW